MAEKARTFYEDGQNALETALRGFVALHPDLHLNAKDKVIYRKPKRDEAQRVTLLSGGGSGHEPSHAGFVGTGMLDAAVCGAIFASPNTLQIEAGLDLIQSPAGTLIIVKNYTGDKLNFTLAAERFRIRSRTPVRLVVVADDVSIGRAKTAKVGRRGLAGTVLVHKIAGAAAREGRSLDEVVEVAEFVVRNMGTMGVSLDGCDVPGKSSPPRLGADEIELGIGIHNEPGSRKLSPKPSPQELVKILLASILDKNDAERNYLASSPLDSAHKVVVLVNNLGGLSSLEIAAFASETYDQLGSTYGIKPARILAGTYLSALNGPGFSITILSLPQSHDFTPKILEYLDSPTNALGWASSISTSSWEARGQDQVELGQDASPQPDLSIPRLECNYTLFKNIINSIHTSLTDAEPEITRLDTKMGDGDCGTTLLAGINSLVQGIEKGAIDTSSLTHGIMAIADSVGQSMGGTSGALYAVFFTALSSSLCGLEDDDKADFTSIVSAFSAALKSLEGVTAARVGDRTMMDALIPFVQSLSQDSSKDVVDALEKALRAAEEGCQGTTNIKSQFGRSTYVSTEDSSDETRGLADPGACGVVAIVQGILNAVKQAE